MPSCVSQKRCHLLRRSRAPKSTNACCLTCRLFCGGTEHVLRCGVRGLLVELNTQLPEARGRGLLT